jgi:hypothetical protein
VLMKAHQLRVQRGDAPHYRPTCGGCDRVAARDKASYRRYFTPLKERPDPP